MNRHHSTSNLKQLPNGDLSQETAIHEAGHATAIYLGNKQRQLPSVFFQIFIKRKSSSHCTSLSNESRTHPEWIAKVEGGRLIHTLPLCIDEATKDFSPAQKHAYHLAFDADIVNLLVGPLAEAKYVALRDNEPINPHLVPVQALQYYGGASDLKIIGEYLECFITEKTERADKIAELFLMAFSFINNPVNWQAIVALADYILRAGKDRIECEEAGLIITQQHL